jgi:ankyrin repeat protein
MYDSGRNALMGAAVFGHTSVVQWLLRTAEAHIADKDQQGATVLSLAAKCGRYSTVQWLLEEGGANITDISANMSDMTLSEPPDELEPKSVWDSVADNLWLCPDESELTSLLKVMVLLGDAPTNFIYKLPLEYAVIIVRGTPIRALRPLYREQQQASVDAHCPLPAVLLAIVTAYAEPTIEDMWTDWICWM